MTTAADVLLYCTGSLHRRLECRVTLRNDDYAGPGKPPCDWDDAEAKEALIDALVGDALAALGALEGEALSRPAAEGAELLALVAGQDVEQGDDATFRIARRVAPDRTISTVDPEARHGHKSHDRRFDGSTVNGSVTHRRADQLPEINDLARFDCPVSRRY